MDWSRISLGVIRVLMVMAIVGFWRNPVLAEEVLEIGDELWVIIPGPLPIKGKVTVDENGHIDLGFYGTSLVTGKSISEALRQMRIDLDSYLESTSGVHLRLHKKGRVVLVTGKVNKPGPINIKSRTDLFQTLQMAGGLENGADLTRVVINRRGKIQVVDVRSFLTRETEMEMPLLKSGDRVFVPADPTYPIAGKVSFLSHEALNRKIFVLGEVRNPGIYDRSADMDPLTALGQAGGPTRDADLSNVRLLTKGEGQKVNLSRRLSGKGDPLYLPSDGGAILYIPPRMSDKDDRLVDSINVIGGVQKPGRINVSGSIRLIDLVGLAGGPSSEGDLSNVRVVRGSGGYTMAMSYDLDRYTEKGGLSGQVIVKPGDTVWVDSDATDYWTDTVSLISNLAMLATSVVLMISIGG